MEVVVCFLNVLLRLILSSIVQYWHTLVNRFRNLKYVFVLCVVNNEIVVLSYKLLHRVFIVKSKVGHTKLSGVVMYCQIVLRKTTCLLHL